MDQSPRQDGPIVLAPQIQPVAPRMTAKIISLLLITDFLTACEIAQRPPPTTGSGQWKSYTNNRFGFRLIYPSSLAGGRDPENSAGKSFASADGRFEVLVHGHFVKEGQSLDSYYTENLAARKGTVTYYRKGPSWYVISGTNEKGFEY